MARRWWWAAGWRIWAYPAAGFAAALGLTCMPWLPFAAGRWPAAGPFGVFTWAAWFVSTALAVTLTLLGGAIRVRRSLRSRAGLGPARWARRVPLAAAGFALLAVLAYSAAARVELIERHPLAALGLAAAALAALRGLTLAAVRSSDGGSASDSLPDPPSPPRPAPPVPIADESDDEAEADPGVPRWASVLATTLAFLLLLLVLLGTAVRWFGPGLGLMLTTRHPVPIFWSETTFFEYDAVKRAGTDASVYLRPPAPDTVDAARRGVLPAGVALAIKGWVEDGAQVRVERDPAGKLVGAWGYVRIGDLAE